MKKISERIIFEDTSEMYDYISEGNDIYSPTAKMYIFSYNDGGSIAYYTIDEEKAKELAQFAKENDEYWGAALGPGGYIIDAEDGDTTDIVMFLADFIHNDWYNTEDYGKMVLTENLKLYYVDFECGMTEKRIVRAKNFEDALVLALTDGFNKETIVDFYDAIDEVHLYEEEPVNEGAAQYRMVNALTLYGNNEGFKNPRRLEDVILNYDNEDIFIDEEDMETFKTLRENLKKHFKEEKPVEETKNLYKVAFYLSEDLVNPDSESEVVKTDSLEKALTWAADSGIQNGRLAAEKVTRAIVYEMKGEGVLYVEVFKTFNREEMIAVFKNLGYNNLVSEFGGKKKYKVTIIEKIEETVTVEAESEEEAEEIADNMVSNGDIILGDGLDSCSNLQYEIKEV